MAERFFENPPEFEDLVVTIALRNKISEEAYKNAYDEWQNILKKLKEGDNGNLYFSGEFTHCFLGPFLNAWKCRRDDETIEHIRETLNRRAEDIKKLAKVDFYEIVENEPRYDWAVDSLKRLLEELYGDETKGVKLTTASKVLGVLLPNLVTMTDTPIVTKFREESHCESGICFTFQRTMWEWGKHIRDKYQNQLSKLLEYAGLSYWTELKLLDAYNWLRISEGIDFNELKP